MSKIPAMGDEKVYGQAIDKCLTGLVFKVGTGVVVGGIFSLLFRRRAWPMTLGGGVGLGMAYTACESQFRSHSTSGVRQITEPENLRPQDTDLPGLLSQVEKEVNDNNSVISDVRSTDPVSQTNNEKGNV